MRKILLIALSVMLLHACGTKRQDSENSIYVSILPLRGLVEQIVGDDFNIEVLVPAGASPETFEPTPKQFIGVNQAQFVFNVGLLDFESNLLKKVDNQEKVINLNQGIQTIAGSCSHASHGHKHAHGVDPHIWTSPKALQQMAATIYEVIHRAYPDSTQYEANYQQLWGDLQALDARTAEKIEQSGIGYFIIYHPALTYYARDYGIEQIAIESEGKEPSAKQLSAIIKRARQDGIRRIFYQNQFPASTVEIIARDIDAQYIEIDPLREDVIANIDEITTAITTR